MTENETVTKLYRNVGNDAEDWINLAQVGNDGAICE